MRTEDRKSARTLPWLLCAQRCSQSRRDEERSQNNNRIWANDDDADVDDEIETVAIEYNDSTVSVLWVEKRMISARANKKNSKTKAMKQQTKKTNERRKGCKIRKYAQRIRVCISLVWLCVRYRLKIEVNNAKKAKQSARKEKNHLIWISMRVYEMRIAWSDFNHLSTIRMTCQFIRSTKHGAAKNKIPFSFDWDNCTNIDCCCIEGTVAIFVH